jgi:predicted nucleic acid-binding protein
VALALDASVVVQAVLSGDGLRRLAGEQLVAPPLLWAETPSVLHELGWRGTISRELADQAFRRFLAGPIEVQWREGLEQEAWGLADQLGWAKTYDAQYVALARMRRCSLLTLDARLRRRASRVVDVVGPTEL